MDSINTTMMRKVPEVTALFWIVKILTTALGESSSDYLVSHMDPIVAVGIGFIAFAAALILQFCVRRYVAWIYWLAALMVAVFGTMAADVLHVGLGIPYDISAIFFLILLIIIFTIWYATERTLSIHSITTRRREIFYWATIVTTFALGTAVGDLTAISFNLGYLYSGIMFAALILAIAAVHYGMQWIKRFASLDTGSSRNAVFVFWLVYILTRPLGASFADWAGKSVSVGGLGLGDGAVSLFLFILILCFVGVMSSNRNKITHS